MQAAPGAAALAVALGLAPVLWIAVLGGVGHPLAGEIGRVLRRLRARGRPSASDGERSV